MEGGVGGAPACLQLVSSSSTTQRVPRGHRHCSPDPPLRCLQLLGLLETIFLTLGISLTEGDTNSLPPGILAFLSMWFFTEPPSPLDPCFPVHFDEGSEGRIAGVGGTDGEGETKLFRCIAGQKSKTIQ